MSKSANMSASEKSKNFLKTGRIYHVKRSSCKGIEKQYVRYSRSSQKKAETNGWAKKNTAAVMVQSRMGCLSIGGGCGRKDFCGSFAKKYPIAAPARFVRISLISVARRVKSCESSMKSVTQRANRSVRRRDWQESQSRGRNSPRGTNSSTFRQAFWKSAGMPARGTRCSVTSGLCRGCSESRPMPELRRNQSRIGWNSKICIRLCAVKIFRIEAKTGEQENPADRQFNECEKEYDT